MDNYDFVDRGAAFEQQIECEGHDLWLPAEGCHQRMFIPFVLLHHRFSFLCLPVCLYV
jgi:hypothetical protein